MTMGPAMAARTLDGSAAETRRDELQAEVLATLKQILAKMEEGQKVEGR
jgi:hypothetical protein